MAQTHFGFENVDEQDKARRVRGVFDSVAQRYDVMNDVLSFGMHRAWKAYTVAVANVRPGDRVLDIAGGTGDLARAFAPKVGPQGLVVSVVRDADKRSIFDLSKEIERLGDAVRNGTATRDELTGSTFTISSLGKLGGVLATPIINFPEVAVVGVHKIEEKPAVRGGQIVIRHLMNLSISVDHRLADGWDGAMFLQDVKALLEDPTTMFMEMV